MGFCLFYDLFNEVNGGSLLSLFKILGDDYYVLCLVGFLVKSILFFFEIVGNF